MAATIVFLLLIALIIAGLQRNHTRERYHDQRLAGGDATEPDRDAQRVLSDLFAVRR